MKTHASLYDALIEHRMPYQEPRIVVPTGEIKDDKRTYELNGHRYILIYDPDLDENNE